MAYFTAINCYDCLYFFIVIGVATRWTVQNKRLQLLETGISASAKTLEIKDKRITINDNPKVDLLSEITDKNGANMNDRHNILFPDWMSINTTLERLLWSRLTR